MVFLGCEREKDHSASAGCRRMKGIPRHSSVIAAAGLCAAAAAVFGILVLAATTTGPGTPAGHRPGHRDFVLLRLTASAQSAQAHDPPASIFTRFLKFGALAWGGPAAQIAMIKRECVDEEGWVSEETFKKTLAVYQVLPGPEAHELCVYFGRIRGGKLGGFLAGLGFMLPGFVLMLGLSILYVEADLAGRPRRALLRAHGGGRRARRAGRSSASSGNFITDVPLARDRGRRPSP